jgi:hypothetical protein
MLTRQIPNQINAIRQMNPCVFLIRVDLELAELYAVETK